MEIINKLLRAIKWSFIWAASIFQEDNGKGSIKRILAFMFSLLAMYLIVHYARNYDNYDWSKLMGIEGLILTFIASLLALMLKRVDDNSK